MYRDRNDIEPDKTTRPEWDVTEYDTIYGGIHIICGWLEMFGGKGRLAMCTYLASNEMMNGIMTLLLWTSESAFRICVPNVKRRTSNVSMWCGWQQPTMTECGGGLCACAWSPPAEFCSGGGLRTTPRNFLNWFWHLILGYSFRARAVRQHNRWLSRVLLVVLWWRWDFANVLTAFDFDVTQLAVHREVLQIHRTRCCDGQPAVVIGQLDNGQSVYVENNRADWFCDNYQMVHEICNYN